MDFLDPRKRQAHKARLIIGYILVAMAIGLSTVILVYAAYGYGFNTKTGQIIQNGLLFVSSHPTKASIYINGAYQNSSTNNRLVLQAGSYNLDLKKTGYRDWQRKVVLDELSVDRFDYPFLFPTKPVAANLKTYSTAPPLFTETPNQHWLLSQISANSTAGTDFDEPA